MQTTLKNALDRLNQGDVQSAISLATTLLENGELNLAEVMKFADRLRAAGQQESSIKFFDFALQSASDPLEAHIGKAQSFVDMGDKPLAMAEIEKIKPLLGDSVDRQVMLFELMLYMRAYSYADEIVSLLISRNPKLFSLRKHKITMCLNRGKPDWAVTELDKVSSTFDLAGSEWAFVARSYLQAKRSDAAVLAAVKAVGKTPSPAHQERLLLAQALVYHDPRKSVRELNDILSQLEGIQTLTKAAEIYFSAGEKEICQNIIGRVIALYKGQELPLHVKINLALLLGSSGDHEQCKALLDTVAIDTINDNLLLRTLHDGAYSLGYYDIAAESAGRGLMLTPYDPEYTIRLTQIMTIGLKDREVTKKKNVMAKSMFRFLRRERSH
jgi:tetratricopeptide (TPR) repeat protein